MRHRDPHDDPPARRRNEPYRGPPVRGLLDRTQQDLADAAHIGVATIRLFEGQGGNRVMRRLQCSGGRLSWPVSSSSKKTAPAPDFGSANPSGRSPPNEDARARPPKRTVSTNAVPGKTAKAAEKKR